MSYINIREVSGTIGTSGIEPTFQKFILPKLQATNSGYKVSIGSTCIEANIGCEDFSRSFAHHHFFHMSMSHEGEKLAVVDRLLSATEARHLDIIERRISEHRFDKDFFWMPSVRKVCYCLNLNFFSLEGRNLDGYCDFSDDDLSAVNYSLLYLGRCRPSKYGLKRILQVFLACLMFH
uniref:Glycosyl transferase n=1 Tax=Heterorhabditis bacteriophora TaxID=37862 RepID=A0A1I7WAN2_HETBA